MTQKKNISKILFSVATIFLLTVFFEVAFCFAYNFDYEIATICVFSFLAAGIAAIYYLLNNAGKIILVSIGAIFVLVWILSIPDFIGEVQDFIYWFIDYAQAVAKQDEEYVGIAKVTAFVLIVINTIFLQGNLIRRISCAIITAGVLVFCGYSQYSMPALIVSIGILYIMVVIIEATLRFTQKQKDEGKRLEAVTKLAPIVAVIMFLTSIIPYSSEPFEWNGMRNTVDFFKDRGDDIADYFGFGNGSDNKTIGFSEDLELGGNVGKDDNVAFEATFYPAPLRKVYIKGAVNDTYTGRGWTKKYDTAVRWGKEEYQVLDETAADYAELFYAIIRSGYYYSASELVNDFSVGIKYDKLNTKCLLYTSKLASSVDTEDDIKTKGATIFFDKKQGSGTKYSYSFSYLNKDCLKFQDFINKQTNYRYDSSNDGNQYIQDYFNVGMDTSVIKDYINEHFILISASYPDNIDEMLEKRAAKIRKENLDVPKSVPARVKDLAKQITAGANTDYEKLKRIENYLSSNYKYTLTPGKLPKGKDAVDYFLFEKKSGYCTYFASAMAIMARSVGIPTRIAQGYVIKGSSLTKYDVTENSAHAWVEGYIEGIGWIDFEPTASFNGSLLPSGSGSSSLIDSSSTNSSSSSSQPSSSIITSSTTDSVDSVSDTSSNTDNAGTVDIQDKAQKGLYILMIIAIILVVILPLLEYLKIKITFAKYHRLYNQSDNNRKVYLDFDAIIKMLDNKKFRINEGETLCEFAGRIEEFNPQLYAYIKYTFELYMKERYGEISIIDSEQKTVQSTRKSAENFIKSKMSPLGYFNLSYKIVKSGNKMCK